MKILKPTKYAPGLSRNILHLRLFIVSASLFFLNMLFADFISLIIVNVYNMSRKISLKSHIYHKQVCYGGNK